MELIEWLNPAGIKIAPLGVTATEDKMKDMIRALNFNGGEVLTLEKLRDRIEFEALTPASVQQGGTENMVCIIYIGGNDLDYMDQTVCYCDCPMVSYEPCRPNKA